MSAEWQFLVTLNERLRPLRDPVKIQEAAVRLLGEHLHVSRVHYVRIEGDEFVVSRSYADGTQVFPTRGSIARFGPTVIDACRRGETVAIEDVRSDPRLADAERKQLLALDIGAFVGVPLIKNGRWLATFGVHNVAAHTWTRTQIALVEMTAERVWAAGERARAEDSVGRSESRQAFLLRLNDTIRPLADPSQILRQTCRLLGTYLRVSRAAYAEINGDDCLIVEEYVDGVAPMTPRFAWRHLAGSLDTDIMNGGTLVLDDTSAGLHTDDERAALEAEGIRAYCCPLLIKDGRFVGAFAIHHRAPRVWLPDEIALVQEVADRTWTTLEHRMAEADRRTSEERLAFLLRLNDALRPLSDAKAIQNTAARLLAEQLGTTRVGYAELAGSEYAIHHEHARGAASLTGPLSGMSIGVTLRDALLRGETIVVHDLEADPRLGDDDRASFRSRQIAAFVGVPLLKAGRMIAAFGANQDRPRAWTKTEIELIRDVAERTWDAVERARAEMAIREQRQRLRLALEASAGGSWSWVAATNQVDWDDRFRALYGFTPDEPARADAWLPRVHPEDRAHAIAKRDEMLKSRTKNSWENTFRIVRPDGRVVWVQSRGRADRDRDGNLTRLTGLDLNFDQYHRAEEQLQSQRDEEHDRTLRMLLETATQGIVSVDARRMIVYANRAFRAMFGWDADDVIGEPIAHLIPELFRDGHEGRDGLHLSGTRKDASIFPIEVVVNHVPSPGGGRAFAFVTDITERQRVASALHERSAELEHRTTQLSQMAWDLTLAEHHAREQTARTLHDGLQQLLVIVAMNLEEQLKLDKEAGATPSERLSEAKAQLDEAIAAARSLNLELFPPVLHRSGIPAALRWLAHWTREKYKLDVHIVADPRADSPRKDIRTLVYESVRELIFNAVKHSRSDRITLEVALDADDRLCVAVNDRGVGFEPAVLDDRSRTTQIGWGLFRIRDRLTLLGGRLDIDSAPGRGTRMCLVAPRGVSPSSAANRGELTSVAFDASSPDDQDLAFPDALRILIVDDHSAVRRALREMLEELPQLSIVGDASNGLEAVGHARTLRPDVILMDVMMPHMDGVEATARILAELPDTHILGLSMQARTANGHAIERAGAAGYFVKGSDTQRLIDHLLDLHMSRSALNGLQA